MTRNGEDVTEAFVNGAYKALEQIKDLQPEYIILKERTILWQFYDLHWRI